MVKITSEKLLTIPTVGKLLMDESAKRDLSSIEQVTLEYARKFGKTMPEKTEQIIEKLSELKIPPEIIVQLVNILPSSRDELRIILAPLSRVFETEELDRILAILNEAKG